MDAVRDLGRDEAWHASHERSMARREVSRDASCNRSREATRSRIRARRAVAIFALTVSGLVVAGALAGPDSNESPIAAHAQVMPRPAHRRVGDARGAGPLSSLLLPPVSRAKLRRGCHLSSDPGGYVNPLRRAHVRPERVDQGVDYAGSGTLVAIGSGRVTHVARTGTGWPGSFIEYRLLDGPETGCHVYYAEGVNPVAGLRVGHRVKAGQPIARIITGWATGIEVGWGAGVSTVSYAEETHHWSPSSDQNSVASAAGKSFSALISALGGPPGKVEG